MQKKGRAGTSRAGKIALYGMMTALAFLLSYVETLIERAKLNGKAVEADT